MCSSAAEGGDALLAAFEAGGAAAQAAVQAMFTASCADRSAVMDAVAAFGDLPEMNDPAQVMR